MHSSTQPNCRHVGRRDDLLCLHSSVLDSHLAQYLQHKHTKWARRPVTEQQTDLSPMGLSQTIHDLRPTWTPQIHGTRGVRMQPPHRTRGALTHYSGDYSLTGLRNGHQACLPGYAEPWLHSPHGDKVEGTLGAQ